MESNTSTPNPQDKASLPPGDSTDKVKWHRSYSAQGRECEKTGNRFKITVPTFYNTTSGVSIDTEVTVCTLLKNYCHSRACKHMRENIEPTVPSRGTNWKWTRTADHLKSREISTGGHSPPIHFPVEEEAGT